MVKTKEFTHKGIMQAIIDGSFYASSGPLIYDFYVKDGVAKVTCAPCQDIYFQTPHRKGSFHSDSEELTEGEFPLNGDEEYVRVTIQRMNREKGMDAAHLALAVLKLNVRKTKVKKMLENMDKYTKNCG